jgi:hypothetical protein
MDLRLLHCFNAGREVEMHGRGLSGLIGLFLLSVPRVPAAADQDLRWTRYRNARFGVGVEYPARLFAAPIEAVNGDGVRFEPQSGVSLRIWGRYNVLNQRPYQALCMRPCTGETDRVDRATAGVSSGLRDGAAIFYKKCVLRDAEFHCFALEYPTSMRRVFDGVAARMSRTLL